MQINPVLFSQLIISGIVGVVIRYGLEVAIGSEVERPFKQFPANMVGCFLVGLLCRLVGPAEAASVSFVASITSFGAWTQALVDTALENGRWQISLFSFLTGLELAYMSFKVGLDVGEMLFPSGFKFKSALEIQSSCTSFTILMFSGSLWLLVTLLGTSTGNRRTLWVAAAASPLGVLIRYFLSKLNRESTPLGTWAANLLASALHTAAGATLLFLFKDADPATVDAFQKGFVDSIGTISAVVAQAHILHTSKRKAWRAYSYVLSTMVTCLATVAIISVAVQRGPCSSTSTSTAII